MKSLFKNSLAAALFCGLVASAGAWQKDYYNSGGNVSTTDYLQVSAGSSISIVGSSTGDYRNVGILLVDSPGGGVTAYLAGSDETTEYGTGGAGTHTVQFTSEVYSGSVNFNVQITW